MNANSAAVARFFAARAAVQPHDAAGLEAPAAILDELDAAQAALSDADLDSPAVVDALRADGWDVAPAASLAA